uniref:Uncharacterized protein n=1 Tax=Amblyomma maculatum TaxID=34609 RepID=G3MKS7_AMBMU
MNSPAETKFYGFSTRHWETERRQRWIHLVRREDLFASALRRLVRGVVPAAILCYNTETSRTGNMDFAETVQKKVQKAQELIDEIETSRRCLQKNCETLRDDVDTACNQQIATICHRKDQLWRQVDMLTAEQERQLESDLARLHQYQGSLLSLLQLYTAGTLKNDFNAFSCLQALELPNVTTVVPQLHFSKMGETELEQAVKRFGSAKLQHACMPGYKDTPKGSDSNESWLLCDVDNCSGEDEVVAASLPKSLSATSSSIEAVSMDEDDAPVVLGKLAIDHPKGSRIANIEHDQSPWLLGSSGYVGNGELLKLTKALSEISTTDTGNHEEVNKTDWLLLPRDSVTSKTSDANSEWLLSGKASPIPTTRSYIMKIRDMFKPYFDHGNDSLWVAYGEK